MEIRSKKAEEKETFGQILDNILFKVGSFIYEVFYDPEGKPKVGIQQSKSMEYRK